MGKPMLRCARMGFRARLSGKVVRKTRIIGIEPRLSSEPPLY